MVRRVLALLMPYLQPILFFLLYVLCLGRDTKDIGTLSMNVDFDPLFALVAFSQVCNHGISVSSLDCSWITPTTKHIHSMHMGVQRFPSIRMQTWLMAAQQVLSYMLLVAINSITLSITSCDGIAFHSIGWSQVFRGFILPSGCFRLSSFRWIWSRSGQAFCFYFTSLWFCDWMDESPYYDGTLSNGSQQRQSVVRLQLQLDPILLTSPISFFKFSLHTKSQAYLSISTMIV